MSAQQEAPKPAAPTPLPLKAFGLAIGIGFVAAAGGSILLEALHLGERFLYQTLPTFFGLDGVPLWWVLAMLVTGAIIIVIAQHLPGNSGHGPLTGFHFDTPPLNAVSILVAAAASLVFAIVFSGTPVSPLATAGIAATSTAMIRLPFTSAMLALLLIGGAGMEVAPFAIIGAVVGFVVRQRMDRLASG